jgi:ribosomal protein S6
MAKKDKAVVAAEETLDSDHSELRAYELGFHLDPDLTEGDAKKAYQALRDLMEKGGSIIAEGEPVKIQLAYTVSRTEQSVRKDFDASYFCWIAYMATGEGHDAVLAAAKADARIFRFIDLRTTKEAAQHAAEIREIMMKMPEKQQEETDASDAEIEAALKEAGV